MPLVVKKRPNINRWVSKVKHTTSDANLTLLANAVITAIQLRTQKGKTINNKAFKSYTPEYAAKKKGKPNLTVTGQMLNSMTSDTYAGGVKIHFPASELGKAVGNQKTRPFFGLSKTNRKMIMKLLKKEF